MIEVDGLTKHYGPTRSIEDVSFRAEKGEVLGFLGPNGAGKSTTMKLLAGLIRPTRGAARIDGIAMQQATPHQRQRLGYLPEGAPLYGDMTLDGFLMYMAGLKGLDHRKSKSEVQRAIGLLNLQKEQNRLIGNLSKGTRQRAAFAQALLGNPPVLLLDEPTVGLDPSQINDVRGLVRSFAGETTVLFSSHILPEVELTCTRIVIIANGRVAAQGTPKELVATEPSEGFARLKGPSNTVERLVADLGGSKRLRLDWTDGEAELRWQPREGEDLRPEIARRAVQAGLDVIEVTLRRARLEDVFLRAIGKGDRK
jgi:ABC-2 type transport system ATP-binding protein